MSIMATPIQVFITLNAVTPEVVSTASITSIDNLVSPIQAQMRTILTDELERSSREIIDLTVPGRHTLHSIRPKNKIPFPCLSSSIRVSRCRSSFLGIQCKNKIDIAANYCSTHNSVSSSICACFSINKKKTQRSINIL